MAIGNTGTTMALAYKTVVPTTQAPGTSSGLAPGIIAAIVVPIVVAAAAALVVLVIVIVVVVLYKKKYSKTKLSVQPIFDELDDRELEWV
jgi:cell division protein FtsN